jgi:hypothetical protein
MKLKPIASDLVVAFPAGLLIFISTALFSTLLGRATGNDIPGSWVGLLVLAFTAFLTGFIIGLLRRERGPATALAAGEMTAVIFLVLRLAARSGENYNTLLFGLPGMVVAILASLPGGLLGSILKKKP